jgi:hypothetical protein
MRLGPAVLPNAALLSSVSEVPWNFLAGSEGRLIPELRGAAQTMDPVEILARAVVQFLEAWSDASGLTRVSLESSFRVRDNVPCRIACAS